MMYATEIDATVSDIFALYEQYGASEYAGEKVSQLEHMCQAGEFAMQEGYDDEVVLAAFMHDVGHLLPVQEAHDSMDGYGVVDHEKLGSEYLRSAGFSERMCRLIASHVNAKRYLTYKDPVYYEQLSDASKKTLKYQGGRMNEAEAKQFESDPLFSLYIKMRRWDEAAKVEHHTMPDISVFRRRAVAHLNNSIGK